LVLTCTGISFGQYSEWKEYGLKGKVKSMVRYHYYFKDELLNPDKIDTSKWSSKIFTYFNANGNVDSVIYYSNPKSYDPEYIGEIHCSKNLYFYDIKGQKRTGLYVPDCSLNIKERMIYEWPNPYTYIERTFDYVTNKVKTEIFAYLHRNLRDSAGVSNYFVGDSIYSSYSYTSTFDSNGRLEYYIERELPRNTIDTVRFKYTSFDKKGNQTKTLIFRNSDAFPKAMYLRTYQYYKD